MYQIIVLIAHKSAIIIIKLPSSAFIQMIVHAHTSRKQIWAMFVRVGSARTVLIWIIILHTVLSLALPLLLMYKMGCAFQNVKPVGNS